MDLVRQRYQLDHPFVLYVGNIKPHKNIERLIDAFGRARSQCPDDLKLVIIGDEISKYPGLRQSVHKHKLDKHVRFLGFQPMETLAAFYRLARAFVFPSLYEGFGLPPLEAMACGSPVVTSNVSSLPEVAGGAALLVDPYDADAIAGGIVQAVTDETLRADLITRGLERARSFSWPQSVKKIHEIYMQVAQDVARPEQGRGSFGSSRHHLCVSARRSAETRRCLDVPTQAARRRLPCHEPRGPRHRLFGRTATSMRSPSSSLRPETRGVEGRIISSEVLDNHWHFVMTCDRIADLADVHALGRGHARQRRAGAHKARGRGYVYQGDTSGAGADEHVAHPGVPVCRAECLRRHLVAAAEHWAWGSLYARCNNRCPIRLSEWPIPRPLG